MLPTEFFRPIYIFFTIQFSSNMMQYFLHQKIIIQKHYNSELEIPYQTTLNSFLVTSR
jgi:hypothetical protein